VIDDDVRESIKELQQRIDTLAKSIAPNAEELTPVVG
jgi:tetrahydromethanopterin S-methyltransferase subunit B